MPGYTVTNEHGTIEIPLKFECEGPEGIAGYLRLIDIGIKNGFNDLLVGPPLTEAVEVDAETTDGSIEPADTPNLS
jgi:hypothetical protein